MSWIIVFLAFVLGILVQRIFVARYKGFSRLGKSWGWSENKFFKLLHRIYCELCPRRLYCESYRKAVKS